MTLSESFLLLAKIEEQSAILYQKFSEECSDKLRPVVCSFSKEEEAHKDYMLELSKKTKQVQIDFDFDIKKIFKNQADYLDSMDEKLNMTLEKDFFGYALQVEKNSIQTYTELLKGIEKNSDCYKKIEVLIKEERKHMIFILNKLYQLR